jgi:hypothetical protein
LEELIEIARWHHPTLECQWFIAVVPPTMRHTCGKHRRFPAVDPDPLPTHETAEHSAQHHAFLALRQMDMERRALAFGRHATFKFQDGFTPDAHATQPKRFTGVSVVELQYVLHEAASAVCLTYRT